MCDGPEANVVHTISRVDHVRSDYNKQWHNTDPKAVGPPHANPSGVVVHLGLAAMAITVTRKP